MRIVELTLTNFLPILAGTGKETIHLDLRDSKELINVLIGKIGSGKTYILSHLQPFSTVGTLDVRNQDDPIIPERDGKKVIVYEKDNHEYIITHDYIWSGKNHTKKSYIEKDGVELNENGNTSSFKDIVQLEFGIDQGVLRLLRLGPNVVNFINMKATERKAYVATLLESTEMYLALYKHWYSDLRTLNTKASILMNKLNSYGSSSLEEIMDDIHSVEEDMNELNHSINEKTKTKYELQAINKTYMGDKTYAELQIEREKISGLIPTVRDNIKDLESKLNSFKNYPELTEVTREIGKLDQKLSNLETSLESLNSKYEASSIELNNLRDKKSIMANESHIKTLQETYQQLLEQSKQYQKELQYFDCEYSATFLSGFLGDLNTINILISEITQYDVDTVKLLMQSDSSVIQYAKKQIEILGYRKIKVQNMITNLKFSETYQAPSPLYFPPLCPTKSCPYYKTHPITIKKKTKTKSEAEEQLIAYQNELRDLDVEIYKYSDYPIIYSKISTLKNMWNTARTVLTKIGALNVSSLMQILTISSYQVWYNYDRIIDTIDLINKRDMYFELTEKIKVIKNELNELSLVDTSNIDNEISRLEHELDELEHTIDTHERDYRETKEALVGYNTMYVDLSEKGIYEESLIKERFSLDTLQERLSELIVNDEKIQMNLQNIHLIDTDITGLTGKLRDKSALLDTLRTRYNDIKYTNTELDEVIQEQKYMTYMVNSVSSKQGIPLVMIQMFLDSCREIVNSLIYDVVEDDVEILPFIINETEFKIPYMVNGQTIDDISKASQGQTSIVSTAMSFALLRQSGAIDYTIPLLDEVDGPLHKSDKRKFISILLKHLKEIGSEQCFVITHDDNTFDGYPVQVIMTTDEVINQDKYSNVIRL